MEATMTVHIFMMFHSTGFAMFRKVENLAEKHLLSCFRFQDVTFADKILWYLLTPDI